MPWLKRNLLLVAGGVVALALLGFAGYFLWAKIQAESEVTDQLTAQTDELQRLKDLNPHPGNEKVNNIEAAKKQEQQLQEFLAQAKTTFAPLNYPTGLDSGQFRLLLDTTIDELQRAAAASGVKIQPQYAFTFGDQKRQMNFDSAVLPSLVMALIDIREVSHILFRSKVLTLDGIRRVAVSSQDTPGLTPGATDYWSKKPFTNDWAISTPYEFTFHCFTAELAAVLEGLYSHPHCFIVKNLVVDTAPTQLLEKEPTQIMPAAPMAMAPGMDFRMMMRYGLLRGPYGMAQPQVAAPPTPAPTARGGLTPMLDEKPFRVIMWVDSLRLKEIEETKPVSAPTPPSPPVEAASN